MISTKGVGEGGSGLTPFGSSPFQPGPTMAKLFALGPVVRLPL
jgi:hypothetical protein